MEDVSFAEDIEPQRCPTGCGGLKLSIRQGSDAESSGDGLAGRKTQRYTAFEVAQRQVRHLTRGSLQVEEGWGDAAVDRADADGKLTLVVRHPDGAFRRFAVVTDGRGIIVADGAEQAKTTIEGDKLAVSVAGDRYLFPAKIKSTATDAKP